MIDRDPTRRALPRIIIMMLAGSCIIGSARGQSSATARSEALKMYDAFVKEEWEVFMDYNYPRLITMMGGREKVIDLLRSTMADMKKAHSSVRSMTVAEPVRTVKAGKEIHALLPTEMIMETSEGELRMRTNLIAISGDKGKTWKFISIDANTHKYLHEILPNFNPKLGLPEVEPPELIKK